MNPVEPPELAPGQVWWCDGSALAFEAHFKRRPVLVLGVRDPGPDGATPEVVVAPLSSARRFGQEQAVTHAGGVSYLTGHMVTVPSDALRKPLGTWDGFAAWSEEQNRPAPTPRGVLLAILKKMAGR